MNINSLGKPSLNSSLPAKSTADEKVQNTDKKTVQKIETHVSVDIKEITKKITKALETSSKEAPAVDKHRIAAIREAIFEGTYPINAEVIAEKMMEMEEQLPKPG